METLNFSTTEQTLLIAIGILLLIQILYYICLYNRIHLRKRSEDKENLHFSKELPPVSVIICAKEEEENLRRNLIAVLEQDYPQFEVIVINDGNSDGSEEYLTLLRERYAHLYHSFIPNSSRYISHKKLAVTLGIKASKYDWLVFTEARCMPQSNQWLRMLARNFTSQTDIVLGYSNYERGHGWLHKRISFDTLFTSLRYLGSALAGMPYMAIGRNMAYRKELYYKQNGFSSHLNLQRGEDDLFVNQAATGQNTRVECNPQSLMRMQPVTTVKEWREEKIGYASTARHYRGIQRYVLGAETSSRLLFHIIWIRLLAISITNMHWLVAALALLTFLLRYAIQCFVINTAAKDLEEKRRYYFTLPVFDILQAMQSLRWKMYCIFRRRSDFLRK